MKKYDPPFALFLLLILALSASPVGCSEDHAASGPVSASSTVAGSATLLGEVTRGPLSPVESAAAPRTSTPAAGLTLLIKNLHDGKIISVTTDEAGSYSVQLPPGSYRIEIKSPPAGGFSKNLPATVTLHAGRQTRYDIRIDTGIR